jgi:glycosyltransferase involved in cell wall biosynthesis
VFVLPSHEEGMSIALLVAMSLGIPAVATAIPGNERVMVDGVHGRLVASGDPAALARAILESWDQQDASVKRARAARHEVIERFSITAVAQQHLRLFESVLRSRKNKEG